MIIVFTGPSGAGKTTLADHAVESVDGAQRFVTATTRDKRPGEVDGEDYHFLTKEEFSNLIEQDGLVEYEEVYDDTYYGTPKKEAARAAPGRPLVVVIEVLGADSFKSVFGADAHVVYVRPSSFDELERRIRARKAESEDEIKERIDRCLMEWERRDDYDEVLINDELETAKRKAVDTVKRYTRSNQ